MGRRSKSNERRTAADLKKQLKDIGKALNEDKLKTLTYARDSSDDSSDYGAGASTGSAGILATATKIVAGLHTQQERLEAVKPLYDTLAKADKPGDAILNAVKALPTGTPRPQFAFMEACNSLAFRCRFDSDRLCH